MSEARGRWITDEHYLDMHTRIDELQTTNAKLLEALESASQRMERARSLLTKNKPTWDKWWGMLDSKDIQEAIAAAKETTRAPL